MSDLLGCKWVVLLANVSVKALVLAALAFLILRALRIETPAIRYAIGFALALGMLVSPAVALALPALWLPLVPRFPDPLLPLHALGIRPYAFVATLYACGAMVQVARVALASWSIRRIVSAARVEWREEGATIVSSPRATAPFTCGVRRPLIVLPSEWRSWPAETLASVLAHERAHVRRHDAAARLVVSIVRSLFWFLPVVPALARMIALEAERACDREAIRTTGDARAYGECLLAMAARSEGRLLASGVAMAMSPRIAQRQSGVVWASSPPPFPLLTDSSHLEARLEDVIALAQEGVPRTNARAASAAFLLTMLVWLAISNLWIVSAAESLRRALS